MIMFIAFDKTQMYKQKSDENFGIIHHKPFGVHLSGSFLTYTIGLN